MDRISWKSTSGLALAAMVCLLAAPASAGITYNVTNDTGHQNGWSLNGTITLSGAGTYSDESAFTAWDITASNGGTSRRYSNVLSNASVSAGGTLVATASDLTLGGGSRLQFFATLPDVGDSLLSELRWINNGGQSVYTGKWVGTDLWVSGGSSANAFSPSVGGLWTLASGGTPSADPVPEIDPAGVGSVLALVTGALGLLEPLSRELDALEKYLAIQQSRFGADLVCRISCEPEARRCWSADDAPAAAGKRLSLWAPVEPDAVECQRRGERP